MLYFFFLVFRYYPLLLQHNSTGPHPLVITLAVAGPVAGNVSKITNLNWIIDGEEMKKELGVKAVYVMNDVRENREKQHTAKNEKTVKHTFLLRVLIHFYINGFCSVLFVSLLVLVMVYLHSNLKI